MPTRNAGATAAVLRHHYDVSNQFFELWLDPRLTYSCALWEDGDSLATAQQRKIDYHVRQARAAGSARVLDIGCGWGSALRRLVEHHGVQHAVGLTPSPAQTAWARSPHHPQIEVRQESWQTHTPDQAYDAIICFEALEHFARTSRPRTAKVRAYRHFLRRCHSWLKPGGRLSLQFIAWGSGVPMDRQTLSDGSHLARILPQSNPPFLSEVMHAAERLFHVEALRSDGHHYQRTCMEWHRRLRRQRSAAVALVSEETVDNYDRYLDVATRFFESEYAHLYRLTLTAAKQPTRRLPTVVFNAGSGLSAKVGAWL
ncbi:SAM-dependent methyltransferase [Streptomyces sp. NPDC051243]|uniref:SAM-dependent methyltransferase n=1 Tax=Streptomyces sp. NPDC051243 TaxID=3365646 RepID=UPI0037B1671E